MAVSQETAQLVVIGGGPAGYPAAFHAADVGMEVTLVDLEENPGGVCLYRGCIPSKALLHVARFLEEAGEIAHCGVHVAKPAVDLAKLRAWKESVVGRLTGGLGQLRGARKVRFVRGRAQFADPHTLEVATADGPVRIPFRKAILATGSRPAVIPGFPVSPRVMDSTAALELPDIPGRLLVVGGGYIGLELGSVYAALGSKVTVVEMLPGLLPGADRDLVAPLAKRLAKRFEAIRLGTKVAAMKDDGARLHVTFEGPEGVREETFDRALVSVGRKPNSENLGLDRAGIEIDRRGFAGVDLQRRTSNPDVYAIGDIAGEPMLAHKGTHEARVAVEAISGRRAAFEPRAIPAVVFTDPEIAWAGLTETEAEKAGQKVAIAKFPWAASGRAMTLERQEGLAKLVVDPESQRVLGVGLTGIGAGDMIAEGALAIEMGALASDLALTIHPHPTLSETVMEAAEAFYGHCTHLAPAHAPRAV
ncbi:MAG: dihydrolipoyl dehydrogenase [Verrucomicrobia bacterium]|nr:dihydrolipoyl dehydrogenase [Verrucomicrobiota bacterium]